VTYKTSSASCPHLRTERYGCQRETDDDDDDDDDDDNDDDVLAEVHFHQNIISPCFLFT
jgi:hypothetical protein